jgi:hypothetical protein
MGPSSPAGPSTYLLAPNSYTYITLPNGGSVVVRTSIYTPQSSGAGAGYTFAISPTYNTTQNPIPYTVSIQSDGTMPGVPNGTEIMRIEFFGNRNNTDFGGSWNGDFQYPFQWYGIFNGDATLRMPAQSIYI